MAMLMLLSPAKTLDYSETAVKEYTQPRHLAQSTALVEVLKEKDESDLKSLMKISDKLAGLNATRYRQFSTPFNLENAKQALLAFKGDVYTGLNAEEFDEEERAFAQKHLRILSGLYGVLRPLDLMQPYRLEMGTRLQTEKGKNLYEFWGDEITETLNRDLADSQDGVVLNLASKEYFSAVKPQNLNARLLNVDFKEDRDGKLKVIAFNAKKARGEMARQIIKGKLESPEEIKALNVNGYLFHDDLSTGDHFVFVK